MSAYSQEKLRLPLIRKVFRQGNIYICGLCKADYHDAGSANSCMNQCWFDIHHFYPVVKRKRSAKAWVFRCLFCCRDYTNELGAYNCAQRCVGIKNNAQLREQLLNEIPLPPPSRPVSRLVMLTKVETPLARPKPKAVVKAVTAPKIIEAPKALAAAIPEPAVPEISHIVMTSSPEPEVSMPEVAATEVEVFRGQHRDSYQIQVELKGDTHRCMYCRSIHSNKVKAQTCFDEHFNDDGYENVVSIDPHA